MKHLNLKHAITLGLSLIFAATVQAGSVRHTDEEGNNRDWTPTGQGHGKPDVNAPDRHEADYKSNGNAKKAGKAAATATGYGIYYHGGPVMDGTTNIYYIWYGNWSADTNAQTILTNFAQNIGGSPYFNINTTYSTSTTAISNSVVYMGSTSDNYSQGSTLSDAGVAKVVSNAITSGRLPSDSHGVYFVLTSKDVKESSGFCTSYCGWHTAGILAAGTPSQTTIKYSFVGDGVQQCPTSCSAQSTVSPNGNTGADAMASVIAHELEEAVTDPTLNAWYDNVGAENGDKCAWNFGTTYAAANGSKANINLGGNDYYIQQNWVNSTNGSTNGFCAMSH